MFRKIRNRIKALRHVKLMSEKAEFYFRDDVFFDLGLDSVIEVHGRVHIGFHHLCSRMYPTYQNSFITLGGNSKLVFYGDTYIAGGLSLTIKNNGVFTFYGNNYVARNSTFICSKEISYGKNSSSSWNFIAIDDDGHLFFDVDGTPINRNYLPLIIEDNVAIQVNVTIPRGITIGKNSVVGASTTLRQNIPSNHLVYSDQNIKMKDNTTFGFQFLNEK